MSSDITDAEVLGYIKKSEDLYRDGAVGLSIAAQRALYNHMAAQFRRPRPAGISVEDMSISGKGNRIAVRIYRPDTLADVRVIYYHGGGFVVGDLDSHDDVCAEISETCGVEIVSVDYRLCPEHPHPASYDDAMSAIDHFADRPLIVAGDSAGGNLAAAIALTTGHRLLGQVLIYPGLGGEALGLPSYTDRAHAPQLTTEDVNYYKWIRAGGPVPVDDPTFAPLAATDVSHAPPCFVSSAEHDPLRDDGPEYVRRLRTAGIAAEAVVEPELPHGHLRARHMSRRASDAFGRICDAVARFAATG